MTRDQYNELEKIYFDWKDLLKSILKASISSRLYLNINTFSDLILRLEKWQKDNKIPNHKMMETEFDYIRPFEHLNRAGSEITINITKAEESEAFDYIQNESGKVLQEIRGLLDFYVDRVDEIIEVEKPIKNYRIIFNEGVLKDSKSGLVIHKYSTKNKIYYFCEYVFAKKKKEWLCWDDIVAALYSDISEDSTKKTKRMIYDMVIRINHHSRFILGSDIIERDRREKYRVLY